MVYHSSSKSVHVMVRINQVFLCSDGIFAVWIINRCSGNTVRVEPPAFQMSLDEEHEQAAANEARHWSHSNEPRPRLPVFSAPPPLVPPPVLMSAPITREESPLSPNFSPFFPSVVPLHLSIPRYPSSVVMHIWDQAEGREVNVVKLCLIWVHF